MNDAANEIVAYYKINNRKITTSKYFEYKTKVTGSKSADNSRLDTEIVVLLNYLSDFLTCLDLTVKQILIYHGHKTV